MRLKNEKLFRGAWNHPLNVTLIYKQQLTVRISLKVLFIRKCELGDACFMKSVYNMACQWCVIYNCAINISK